MSDEQLRKQVADALRLYSHVHKGQACIYLGAALTAVMPIVAKVQAERAVPVVEPKYCGYRYDGSYGLVPAGTPGAERVED